MKQKYYLRGLGFGILITSLVFIFANPSEPSDEEIIKRAKELGYVKTEQSDSSINLKDLMGTETPAPSKDIFTVHTPIPKETLTPTPTVSPTKEPTPSPTEMPEATLTPTPEPTPTNTPTPDPTETPIPTFTPTPTPSPSPVPAVITAVITVERGNSAIMVCDKIEAAGIVNDGEALKEYFVNNNLADYINIGSYTLSSDMSFEDIANILTER